MFGEDPKEQTATAGHVELVVHAFEVGMNGVGGEAELQCDRGFLFIIKDFLSDLQLPRRKRERRSDRTPLTVGQYRAPGRVPLGIRDSLLRIWGPRV